MTAPLRTAAVGLGWVTQARHIPAMRRNPRYELIGVVDRAPGRAKALASKLGCPNHAETGDLSAVSWLDQVDAITVGTAPMTHHDVVCQALRLGKHVITEKPFAASVAEGEGMVRVAEQNDRQLAVVHNFQFARSTRRLLAELESGRLGAVMGLSAIQLGNPGRRLPTWYEELPLGLFYDESPHLLYLLRRLAGGLSLAKAVTVPSTRGLNTPARIDAWFRAPDAAYPITLSCNFESPVSEWHLLVFGEKRLAIVDVFRDIYLSLPNDGNHDTRTVLRTSVAASAQHWIQHVTSGIPHLTGRLLYGNDQVFDRFARAATGEPSALEPISAAAGLDVLKLQHAIIDNQEIVA
ncbi:Gfo/Idh/MocA family protein [Sphingosinicella sp. BN140058]|uniref:Gfo/Idh/MocA family protein n=1 Tax=Sphingosinicella sp. BN140058 TaxID=1892855 RepID=UPI001011F152|nr:Gfo/Idh/MocA family oxidoreductase [Sphingosinicella sp. BN140058]QAY76982.1 Gfo/Idh/MocA family oxidoreductase [Sphingosinicella sp. BN140058]